MTTQLIQGKYSLSQNCAIISPSGNEKDTRFFHYLLQHIFPFEKRIISLIMQPSLRFSDLVQYRILYPPLSEQRAIADFLDCKTAKIDTLIDKKQRQFELLEEHRTALINQAVTKGLNPDAPLKDSGIEWLGEAPEHWECLHIKYLFQLSDYGVSDRLIRSGKYTILTMGDIQEGEVIIPDSRCLDEIPDGLLLQKNDLLYNRTNSRNLVAKVGIFRGERSDNVSFASYLVRFRTKQNINSEYLNYLLNSSMFISWARSHALPSINQSNLNPTKFGNLSICVPSFDEQEEILQSLYTITISIRDKLSSIEKTISLLQEYRTALTSAAVTGKIDVRDEGWVNGT